jgi:hypothetical protein
MPRDKPPTKNIQLFLFILYVLGKVVGRIKLYKIHYLIEREGHVKYDMPISNYPLGPVDYVTIDYCTQNNLIQDELHRGIPYDFHEIFLTPKGKKYFEKECKSLLSTEEKKRAKKIIKKYCGLTGKQILDHVHKKYVDRFKSTKETMQITNGFLKNIPIYQNLIEKNIKSGISLEEEDSLYSAIEYLHHVEAILRGMHKVKDPVQRGQVLCTVEELFGALKENEYRSNAYITELFDYLDSYCEKEKICKSISSEELSDIPKGVRERLLKAIAQMKIPPSS